MDDISLEDVEQFEEARLAQVRRKVSRVDSLKKFLFSSRLEEKKTRNTAGRQWQRELNQPAVKTTIDSGTVGLHYTMEDIIGSVLSLNVVHHKT